MSGLVVTNIICFQIQKKLATLNNIRMLFKSVLIDLRARDFVHAKRFLRARCVHARQRAHNLSSPAKASPFYSFEVCKKIARQLDILAILYFYRFAIIFNLTLQQVLLVIELNEVRNFCQ